MLKYEMVSLFIIFLINHHFYLNSICFIAIIGAIIYFEAFLLVKDNLYCCYGLFHAALTMGIWTMQINSTNIK